MIYLICAQDSKKRIAELDTQSDIKTNFYKYILSITNHRNVLYSYDFYRNVTKNVLPNRVNVIFSRDRKHKVMINNAIIVNSMREILSTYSNNVDDVYVIASSKEVVDFFGNKADYLIIYETNELGHTVQLMNELVNFANYNLLKTEEYKDHKIHYFVVNPDNFLGN